MNPTNCILAGGVLAFVSSPVLAHHSFAMFDSSKAISMTGILKEYEWTNPHVWIHIMAPDTQGAAREWSFEMQSVQQDAAAGWRPDSVKPGDRVTIEFHPLKDGSRGGQLMNATLTNGQHLGPPAAAAQVFGRPPRD